MGAGVAAGGKFWPMAGLAAVAVTLLRRAEARGWLVWGAGQLSGRERLRGYGVAVVAASLVIIYVWLTGGKDSPLLAALYLPVVLAVFCYGIGVGLTTSLAMSAVYLADALWRSAPGSLLLRDEIGVALSFPFAAVFIGLLGRGIEERCRVLDDRTHEMSTLLDMSQMINSAYDLDMTLDLILLNVQKMSGCEICAVYLKSADDDALQLRADITPTNYPSLLPTLPLVDVRHGDWSLETRAVMPGDLAVTCYVPVLEASDETLSSLLQIDRRAQSLACFPLTSLEGLLGMVYVGSDQPWGLTPDRIAPLEQLATRAAFPLQRVLLQQGFQSLAYTDTLTGLDNRRQFQQTLAEEAARAERYGRKLSLLMLDIDRFKSFNDTLGHPAGDALLAQLAVVLRNALRTVDRPARYGGEEFSVLCPETGQEEAHLIAERIRRTVAETPFLLGERAEAASVTVSIGYATYPADARATADLIQKADQALYAAKAGGRNAVRGHDESVLPSAAAPARSKADSGTMPLHRPKKPSKKLTSAR